MKSIIRQLKLCICNRELGFLAWVKRYGLLYAIRSICTTNGRGGAWHITVKAILMERDNNG